MVAQLLLNFIIKNKNGCPFFALSENVEKRGFLPHTSNTFNNTLASIQNSYLEANDVKYTC